MVPKLAIAIRDNDGVWRSATSDLPIDDMRAFKGSLLIHVGGGYAASVAVMPKEPVAMERRVDERRTKVDIPLQS